MSKSTRMTAEQLLALGLVETEPGVYAKKTINVKSLYDDIREKELPKDCVGASDFNEQVFGAKYLHKNPLIPDEIIKPKVYCGIDPGKSGGIAFCFNGVLYKWIIPVIGKDIDGNELYRIVDGIKQEFDPIIILEDVHSVFGSSASSNFQFGYVCGFLKAMVVAHKIPFHMVQPKAWQKLLWTNDDKVYKPKKPEQKNPSIDTKATSLKAATRIFPTFDFTKNDRSKKAHDGIVDAILLAEYGRRLNL